MANANIVEQPRPVALLMPWRDSLKVLLAGVLVGLVTFALYLLLDKYLFTPTLCNDLNAGTGRCENKLFFSSSIAMIISAIVGLFFVVQQRVFRPLLVVLLVTIGLWNVLMLTVGLSTWLSALMTVIIFALAYGAFAWLVQIRNLVVALGISIALVVAMRIILIS